MLENIIKKGGNLLSSFWYLGECIWATEALLNTEALQSASHTPFHRRAYLSE